MIFANQKVTSISQAINIIENPPSIDSYAGPSYILSYPIKEVMLRGAPRQYSWEAVTSLEDLFHLDYTHRSKSEVQNLLSQVKNRINYYKNQPSQNTATPSQNSQQQYEQLINPKPLDALEEARKFAERQQPIDLVAIEYKIEQLQKYYNYGSKYIRAADKAAAACVKAKEEAKKFVDRQLKIYEANPNIENPWEEANALENFGAGLRNLFGQGGFSAGKKVATTPEQYIQQKCIEASNKAFNSVMAEGDPSPSGPKKPAGPRQVVSARLSEQAALMVNLHNIIKKDFAVDRSNKISRENVKYRNFSVVRVKDAGHNAITSRFTKHEHMAYYFDKLPPSVLSMLVPSIKMYKIFYPELHSLGKDQEKLNKKNVDRKINSALKQSYHWRIPFDDVPIQYKNQTSQIPPDSIEEVLNGNGSLHTVGIKSFNYEFSGNNPASARAVVKASIKLFFENPADLVKEVPVKVEKSKVDYTFSYSDLMNWSNRNNLNGPNKYLPNEHYYRIKVICGYGDVDEGLIEQHLGNLHFTPEKIKEVIQIIKSTSIVMFLSPFSYDVAFQENGSVELTINYNGQTETVMTNKEADIFYSTEASQKAIKLQAFLEKKSSESDKEKDQKKSPSRQELCQKDKLEKEIKEAAKEAGIGTPNKIDVEKIKKQIINLKKESYNAVFKKLIGHGGGKNKEKQTHPTAGVYSVYIKTGLIQTISSEKSNDGRLKEVELGKDTDVQMLRLENVNYKNSLLRNAVPKAKKGDTAAGKADLAKVAEQQAKAIDDKKSEQTKIGNIAYTKIRFFFLGDILDAAMECMRNITPVVDRPRIVIGEMPIIFPTKLNATIKTTDRLSKKRSYYNLADIPISFDLFQQFFLQKVVATERDRYPVLEFIKDVIGELIIPAVSPNVLDDGAAFNSKLNYSTLNISVPAPDNKDPLILNYSKKDKKYSHQDLYEEQSYNGIIINDELLSEISKSRINLVNSKDLNDVANYVFIYCSSMMPFANDNEKTPKEMEQQDTTNGIYHAKMGTDSGIVKKIAFKKSEIPYQREMIARNNGKNLGTSIKQVYNADVTLFGNNIYYPGDYLYINPIFAFDKGGLVDLQEKLGIGGYYMVTKVNTSISESGFETKLDCVYQASLETVKDGKAKRVDVYNDDDCGVSAT